MIALNSNENLWFDKIPNSICNVADDCISLCFDCICIGLDPVCFDCFHKN